MVNSGDNFSVSSMLVCSGEGMRERGWEQVDIILVTGEAYVDHPAWGVALIGRYLEGLGYRVAVLAGPDWRSADDFRRFGRPRLFWGITSGCIDSRLNDYASMGHKRRGRDVYLPVGYEGGRAGKPLQSYTARAKEAYKDVPVVLGGLEASLKRLVYYDYISEKLRPSILVESKADLLVFGMGERAIGEVARRLDRGEDIRSITDVRGTAYRVVGDINVPAGAVRIKGYAEQETDSRAVMDAHLAYEKACGRGDACVQKQVGVDDVVVMPAAGELSGDELDEVYDLPFARRAFGFEGRSAEVAALEPVRFSIVTHRGCFGGCSFCSIYFHQGKKVVSRSVDSILAEAERLSERDDFNGTIEDVGGPTANMYGMGCERVDECGRVSCLYPDICERLDVSHREVLRLYKALVEWKRGKQRAGRKVNVFVASGVRHDLAVRSRDYVELLASEFVGGHLKAAPEHYCKRVLELMGKPGFEVYERFEKLFEVASERAGKRQFIVPYFISGHPGAGVEEAAELTAYLVRRGIKPRQVQDFVPSPMTLATAMFVSGVDERGRGIYVARGQGEKSLQLAMLQYYLRGNYKLIEPVLKEIGMGGLLGSIRRVQDDEVKGKGADRGGRSKGSGKGKGGGGKSRRRSKEEKGSKQAGGNSKGGGGKQNKRFKRSSRKRGF